MTSIPPNLEELVCKHVAEHFNYTNCARYNHDQSGVLLKYLKAHGLESKAVCPICNQPDFTHVNGCTERMVENHHDKT